MTGPNVESHQSAAGAAIDIGDKECWARLTHGHDLDSSAAAWLELLSSRLASSNFRGVVVLGTPDTGPFAPAAVWPKDMPGSASLVAGVEKAISRRQTVLETGRYSSGEGAARRRIDILAEPLLIDGHVYGAVSIEVEHGPDEKLEPMLAELRWAMVALEALARRHRAVASDRLVTVLELIATSLHQERFQAAATAVATELAGILKCERVSIGFMKGQHVRVRAISHSASFGKKANVVRAIEAAMDESIDQQATVSYPPVPGGPLQVIRAHEELVRDHSRGVVCSVPMAEGERIIGAITLERPADQPFDERTLQLCEHAGALLGPVLDVRRKDDRWLGAKAWENLKSLTRKLTGPRQVALKLITAAIVLVVVFFTFADGMYRVTADARLEGAVQRAVAAPLAGYIAEANVRAGDIVREGDLIFSLDDRDLWLERLKWLSQKSQYEREYNEAVAARSRAQANVLAAQVEQAQAQVALIEEQLSRVKVTAPFDGVIVSGDLSQSLGVPVERGDVLFELAPLHDYRIILEVEERDIGQLQPGQSGLLALTGLPGETLALMVQRITPVSSAEEGRNFFRVEANIVGDTPSLLRPGMEGVGKVEIEERKLIWIWSHKITYWLRMFFWSWWP